MVLVRPTFILFYLHFLLLLGIRMGVVFLESSVELFIQSLKVLKFCYSIILFLELCLKINRMLLQINSQGYLSQ